MFELQFDQWHSVMIVQQKCHYNLHSFFRVMTQSPVLPVLSRYSTEKRENQQQLKTLSWETCSAYMTSQSG